ncbi:MAG: hydrogenase nickel incorporation protein HypB [Oscillospiraceae bacterium]|nr:hydrogenase nickel incorporation protein HypB [Oscillospiraceae bacterium]
MKTIQLNATVTASNQRDADKLREEMRRSGTLLINIMSGPGSGKTSLLSRLIQDMRDIKISVMEADIASDVDAKRIETLGAKSIQVHTSGMCHMDAGMTTAAWDSLDAQNSDLVFLENVGNLICPAEYDTGAGKKIMLLSVPEGDDKPLKYPLMFRESDALVITKTDTADYFHFDYSKCEERVRAIHPEIKIFSVSAKTGEGMDILENWLRNSLMEWRQSGRKGV